MGEAVEAALRVTEELILPAEELRWRFSRSSGPGGQGVNTADSRVELLWSPADSRAVAALPDHLRDRLLAALAPRLVGGNLVVAASASRAQLANRQAARLRLADVLRRALTPPSPPRRPTRPGRGAVERRLAAKRARARTKSDRARPRHED